MEDVTIGGQLDNDIVEQMASLGFSPEIVLDSISNDKYDVAASTYYLLLARKLKNKGVVEYVFPLVVAYFVDFIGCTF